MRPTLLFALTCLALSACNGIQPTGPAGQASSNAVNPETGSRAGSGSK